MEKETINKMEDFFSMLRFRDEINNSNFIIRFNRGQGKTTYMLKHFQLMKQFYDIDKTDEDFLNELKENGGVLFKNLKQ